MKAVEIKKKLRLFYKIMAMQPTCFKRNNKRCTNHYWNHNACWDFTGISNKSVNQCCNPHWINDDLKIFFAIFANSSASIHVSSLTQPTFWVSNRENLEVHTNFKKIILDHCLSLDLGEIWQTTAIYCIVVKLDFFLNFR